VPAIVPSPAPGLHDARQNGRVNGPATPTPRSGARDDGRVRDGVPGPSTRWYVVALLVGVVGGAVGAVTVALSLAALDVGPSSYQRVGVPGDAALELDRPGEYRLYGETADAGGPLDTVDPPVVTLRAPDGTTVVVRSTTVSASTSHTVEGRAGYRIGSFVVSRPGTYSLTVRRRTDGDPDAHTQSGAVAALAPDRVAVEAPVRGMAVVGALAGGSVFAVAGLVALGMLLVTFVLRERVRRRWATGSPR
jgi:hypothetical protein